MLGRGEMEHEPETCGLVSQIQPASWRSIRLDNKAAFVPDEGQGAALILGRIPMCKLFISADPQLWESTTRSLRIDGMVTSVRLETFFWTVLEEIAGRDGMNVVQLITRLHHESIDAGHDLGNFTSFLRVCCGRYLALQLSGHVPLDRRIPISGIEPEAVFKTERGRLPLDKGGLREH